MIKLFSKGVYLINNKEIIEDCNDINLILKNKLGNKCINKEEARKNTIAYNILNEHNQVSALQDITYHLRKYQQPYCMKDKCCPLMVHRLLLNIYVFHI